MCCPLHSTPPLFTPFSASTAWDIGTPAAFWGPLGEPWGQGGGGKGRGSLSPAAGWQCCEGDSRSHDAPAGCGESTVLPQRWQWNNLITRCFYTSEPHSAASGLTSSHSHLCYSSPGFLSSFWLFGWVVIGQWVARWLRGIIPRSPPLW